MFQACKSQPCVFLLKDIDQLDVSLLNEISSLMSSTAAAGDWIEFMGSSQHVTRVTGPTHKWLGVKLVEVTSLIKHLTKPLHSVHY